MCSVSCQKAFVATLESSMAYIAVGSYLAFFVLIIVTFWNSQTHHGCWCIKPSQDEDDDENTTMSIPLGMVYIAYVLNGTMALIGLFEAAIAAAPAHVVVASTSSAIGGTSRSRPIATRLGESLARPPSSSRGA